MSSRSGFSFFTIGCVPPTKSPKPKMVLTSSSLDVGDVATYSCNINFGFCGNVDSTITCLGSGDWSPLSPSAVCHRTYWDFTLVRKRPYVKMKFPCIAYRNSNITVIGKPTAKRNTQGIRFSYDLQHGSNATYAHISVILHNKTGVILTNDNHGDKWGFEKRAYSNFPFKVNQSFEMVFKLEETHVVVLADSERLTTQTFKTSDPGIDQIAILDLSIQNMTINYP